MTIPFPTTLLIFLALLWVKAISPSASGIADPDFYWHLTYGQWMATNFAIPDKDFFSWSFTGQPYQLTQWLGEAVMGFAYNFGGLSGTKFVSVLLTAITIGFSWLAARRFVHNSVAFGLAVMCNLVQVVIPMRPQLFSFALLSVAAYLIVSYIATRRIRYLLAYPVLMALWVNLHGGFIVGLIFIGLMATGLTAEAYLANRRLVISKEDIAAWGVVGISTLATLLNPYGIDAILTVLMIGGLKSSSVIFEWMPVNITTVPGWFYLMIIAPFVALLVLSEEKPRLSHALIAGFFLIFGILANRQVPIAGAVMAPFTAALLARTSQYSRMLPTLEDPSRPLLHLAIAAVLAFSYPWIAAKGDGKWEATMNLQYPLKASDFLEEHGLEKRVMSDILESSYLIHRGIPVFLDARLDLYRDQFFFEWYLASRATPGWEDIIEKHQPSAMLLRVDMAIRQAALAGGKWKQVYEDDRYSILVPSDSSLPVVPIQRINYLDQDGGMIRPYLP